MISVLLMIGTLSGSDLHPANESDATIQVELRKMWSAFQCDHYSLLLDGVDSERDFLKVGYLAGHNALKEIRKNRSNTNDLLPLLEGGLVPPDVFVRIDLNNTDDFIVGRVYEKAFNDVVEKLDDNISKTNPTKTKAIRASARYAFETENCRYLVD